MATTPNMKIDLPIVSVTIGPIWASMLNSAFFQRVDAHDHSPDNGVRITPAGLNINSDLTFASNNANNLRSTRYINSPSTLSNPEDLRSLYVSGGNLYYNNGAGTPIQITSGTSVLSSADGLSRRFESENVGGNLTINPSDSYSYIKVDTTTSITINLPLAAGTADGRFYVIKDVTGLAETNNVTVVPNGTDEIDGANASTVIDHDYGFVVLTSNGVDEWAVTNHSVVIPDPPVPVDSVYDIATAGSADASGSSFATVSGGGATIDVLAGEDVKIDLTDMQSIVGLGGDGGWINCELRLRRGGTTVKTVALDWFWPASGAGLDSMAASTIPSSFLDSPPAGTHTYTVQVRIVSSSNGTGDSFYLSTRILASIL